MTDNETASAGVDAIIDSAVATESPNAPQENTAPEPESDDTAEEHKPVDRDKATQNRLSRLERRIGQLTAQKYQTAQERDELRQKLSQYEQGKASQESDGRPQEKDFEGKPYSEYLDAVTEWKVEQKFKQATQKTQEQSKVVEDQRWTEQRINHATENADKAKAAFADYQQLYNDYSDVLGSLPPQIEKVLLESENPSFAFYQMAKDGTIENLASMSPTQAAGVIALAGYKALALSKPVTNAPTPLASAKGTASGKKSLDQMTPDELKKWYS